ncbi:hypothetical protein G6F22_018823 [Rhizopus arrhizus]|nr:hypothetical protein G6F22_018823 [Rhizopus arrhizus]
MVDEGVAVALERGQPVRPYAVLVQRAAEIGGHLFAAEAPRLHIQFPQRFEGGAFADGVDDTARRHCAEEDRRGAFQELDPFQTVGLLPAVVDVDGVQGAVAVIAALVRAKSS